MRATALLVVLFMVIIVSTAKADERPTLSPGVPPWFATVGQLNLDKGNIVLDRTTVQFVTEEVTRNVMLNGKVEPIKQKITKPVYEQTCKIISLESAKFAEAGGKKINAADIAKRLDVGTVVVVSTDGKEIDSAYLKALAKDAIVIVDIGVTYPVVESGVVPPAAFYQAPAALPSPARVNK